MTSSLASFRNASPSTGATRCRRKFLCYFKGGFRDEKYLAWERNYKQSAHEQWQEFLSPKLFGGLLRQKRFSEIAAHAVRIESRTNLLFSFEKMALRDAVKSPSGARQFAEGLGEFLHGKGSPQKRFEAWRDVIGELPRRQTRVLTWPLVTIFGFIAQPHIHLFLKPNVTRRAAENYGFDFHYASRPTWDVYASLLEFAQVMRRDLADLQPLDQIDLQSFAWVQGSDEYP